MGDRNDTVSMRDKAIKKFVGMLVPAVRCPVCGFPLSIAAGIHWRDNGTMSPLFVSKYMRVVMLPTALYDGLFEKLETQLGISIDHILFEAQRNISRSLFESFRSVFPPLEYLRRMTLCKRLATELFNKVGLLSGMGYSNTIEYHPGEYVIVRMKNPYNAELVSANGVGGLEMVEGRPLKSEVIDEGGNSYLIRSTIVGERPAISERLKVERPVLIPGNLDYDRCFLCRTPKVVSSRFEWKENEGKMIDRRSGSRVIIMDGFLLNTVLRELAKELGEDVYGLLLSAQRDWTIEHVEMLGIAQQSASFNSREFEDAFKGYLKDLPVFGYGNPVSFEVTGPKVKVIIENPFQDEVIAGTLQGLYRIFSGEECRIDWAATGKAAVCYSLQPC